MYDRFIKFIIYIINLLTLIALADISQHHFRRR